MQYSNAVQCSCRTQLVLASRANAMQLMLGCAVLLLLLSHACMQCSTTLRVGLGCKDPDVGNYSKAPPQDT